MGKTYKDQANYHRFHEEADGPAEQHVKDKLEIFSIPSKCNVARRCGKNRKTHAKSKIYERRIRRAKERSQDIDLE